MVARVNDYLEVSFLRCKKPEMGKGGEVVLLDIEICAGGVVIKDHKVVSLRRKNGVWLMPKGHVDPGETLEEAAVREVWEETGLEARIGAPLGETEYGFSEDGVWHQKKVFWFYMEAIGGELRPEAEMFTETRLLSLGELTTLTFPADRQLAAKALTINLS